VGFLLSFPLKFNGVRADKFVMAAEGGKMVRIAVMADTHHGFSAVQNEMNGRMLVTLAAEKPDLVLHGGDVQSDKPEQALEFWQLYRSIPGLETVPTLCVMGNHDYWGSKTLQAEEEHRSVCEKNSIILLSGTTYEVGNDVIVGGASGWYWNPHARTNDKARIKDYFIFGSAYLRKKADTEFEQVMGQLKRASSKTKIFLSHFDFISSQVQPNFATSFGANPRLEEHVDGVDLVISGHSHRMVFAVPCGPSKQQMYYNPGGGYEDPNYFVLDV